MKFAVATVETRRVVALRNTTESRAIQGMLNTIPSKSFVVARSTVSHATLMSNTVN